MLTTSLIVTLLVWIGWTLLDTQTLKKDQVDALRTFVAENFPVRQNIHISFENTGLRFPDLVAAAQLQLDHVLHERKIPFRYTLVDDLPQRFNPYETAPAPEPGPMIITVDATTGTNTETATSTANTTGIETEKDPSSDIKREKPTYVVSLALSDSVSLYHDIYALKVIMGYDLNAVHKNDMPFFVAQAVVDQLLAEEFSTAEKLKNASFADYTPRLDVHFVAAEELGNTPKQIVSAIQAHFATLKERLYPFLDLRVRFDTVDVTKSRLRPVNTKNTTNTINFVYLTSLVGFADIIQGVPIYHLTSAAVEDLKEDEVLYGTELLQRQQALSSSTYNITSFVSAATSHILSAAGFPSLDSVNMEMRSESAMKHYTLIGIAEELDRITESFSEIAFLDVARLVDHILSQDEHDWQEYLLQVSEWHRRAYAI